MVHLDARRRLLTPALDLVRLARFYPKPAGRLPQDGWQPRQGYTKSVRGLKIMIEFQDLDRPSGPDE
jgi:hypothetical protein